MALFDKDKKIPEAEAEFDMTEIVAAAARLKGNKPPSGRVIVPASTFPVSAQIRKEEADAAAKREEIPEVGQKMQDGSVYAGLTADGKQRIFAMPEDLDVVATFNDAARAVEKLNANKYLGCEDWQIPSMKTLQVLQENQNEGSLKDTFKQVAEEDEYGENFYWSSTENPRDTNHLHIIRFMDGQDNWGFKGYDYSNEISPLACRPVRLVAI
jgi:hypothetical protein